MYIYYVDDNEVGRRLCIREFLSSHEEFFIGRLNDEDLERIRKVERGVSFDYLCWGLFIFTPTSSGLKYYSLGVKRTSVSRRHVKLLYRHGGLVVCDHGVDGRGSANGTFINGIKVPRGACVEIDDGSRINLGYYFDIICLSGESVVERIPIGIPVRLDRATRRVLEKNRITSREIHTNESVLFIVEDVPSSLLNKEITIDEGRRVVFERNNERFLHSLLQATYEFIIKQEEDKALYLVSLLDTSLMKNLVNSIYGEKSEEYLERINSFKQVLKQFINKVIGREIALNSVKQLKSILEAMKDLVSNGNSKVWYQEDLHD